MSRERSLQPWFSASNCCVDRFHRRYEKHPTSAVLSLLFLPQPSRRRAHMRFEVTLKETWEHYLLSENLKSENDRPGWQPKTVDTLTSEFHWNILLLISSDATASIREVPYATLFSPAGSTVSSTRFAEASHIFLPQAFIFLLSQT